MFEIANHYIQEIATIILVVQGPVLIASSEGGVNIEEIAEKNPDAIVKTPIDITQGLSLDTAKVTIFPC